MGTPGVWASTLSLSGLTHCVSFSDLKPKYQNQVVLFPVGRAAARTQKWPPSLPSQGDAQCDYLYPIGAPQKVQACFMGHAWLILPFLSTASLHSRMHVGLSETEQRDSCH